MKLAEALSQRAALMQKYQNLRSLLGDCVKVQEGDQPVETPQQVIKDIDSTLGELQRIIYLINVTNTRTMVEGRSLTWLLAERDILSMKVRSLNDALSKLMEREDRYNRNEIKYVRVVDAKEFRKLYDSSAARLRELDLKIQGIGWTTDLIED